MSRCARCCKDIESLGAWWGFDGQLYCSRDCMRGTGTGPAPDALNLAGARFTSQLLTSEANEPERVDYRLGDTVTAPDGGTLVCVAAGKTPPMPPARTVQEGDMLLRRGEVGVVYRVLNAGRIAFFAKEERTGALRSATYDNPDWRHEDGSPIRAPSPGTPGTFRERYTEPLLPVMVTAKGYAGACVPHGPPTREGLRTLLEEHIPAATRVDDALLFLIDHEVLARALWEADPDVRKLVSSKADNCIEQRGQPRLRYEGRPSADPTDASTTLDVDRYLRALEIAWKIDDGGLRSKWTTLVARALRR